jgi:four helix bundle protein
MKQEKFDFENLEIWQKSVQFAKEVILSLEGINSQRNHFRIKEQLEAACTSISMNIAEGKGRNSKKEFLQFLYYSRGSVYEAITLLKIMRETGWIPEETFSTLKSNAIILSKMLNSFISYQRSQLK